MYYVYYSGLLTLSTNSAMLDTALNVVSVLDQVSAKFVMSAIRYIFVMSARSYICDANPLHFLVTVNIES